VSRGPRETSKISKSAHAATLCLSFSQLCRLTRASLLAAISLMHRQILYRLFRSLIFIARPSSAKRPEQPSSSWKVIARNHMVEILAIPGEVLTEPYEAKPLLHPMEMGCSTRDGTFIKLIDDLYCLCASLELCATIIAAEPSFCFSLLCVNRLLVMSRPRCQRESGYLSGYRSVRARSGRGGMTWATIPGLGPHRRKLL
jgi:hypothetical protein